VIGWLVVICRQVGGLRHWLVEVECLAISSMLVGPYVLRCYRTGRLQDLSLSVVVLSVPTVHLQVECKSGKRGYSVCTR
jgi:hypothetical protein